MLFDLDQNNTDDHSDLTWIKSMHYGLLHQVYNRHKPHLPLHLAHQQILDGERLCVQTFCTSSL